jgi:hypothetical protein
MSPLQRHTPVRAVPSTGGSPKTASRGGTPLMGFIDTSPSPTHLPLRPLPDEPSLILRPGTAKSRTRSIPAVPPGFDGFLRSETPVRRPMSLGSSQVCCTLQPAVGSTCVSGFLESEDSAALHPGGARFAGSRSRRRRPFEAFPSPVATLCHRGPPRSPEGIALSSLIQQSVSPRTAEPRPQGFAPPWSPFPNATLPPRPGRCSHGLLDRSRSCLPRVERGRTQGPPSTSGRWPTKCSRGPSAWGGKVSRLCLALETYAAAGPRRVRQVASAAAGSPKTAACSPKTAAAPPVAFRHRDRSVARWPDPKVGLWPCRQSIPKDGPTTWTAAPKNRCHPVRNTRRCHGSVGRQPRPKAVPTTSRAPRRAHGFQAVLPVLGPRDPRRDPASSRRLGCLARLAHPKVYFAARHPRPPPGVQVLAPHASRRRVLGRMWERAKPRRARRGYRPPENWVSAKARQTWIHRERTGPKPLRQPEGRRTDVDSSGARTSRANHHVGGFRYRTPKCSAPGRTEVPLGYLPLA